jgi:protein-glutamine gamma-glutamyltransferase
MSAEVHTRRTIIQLLLRLLFEAVPTAAIVYFTLAFVNISYTGLNTGIMQQAIYFALGLFVSYSLYFYRARFLVSFIILWLLYLLADRIIGRLPGEFDVFYRTVSFKLYSTLFIVGWIFGFILVRLRFASVVISVLLAVMTLISASGHAHESAQSVSDTLFHIFPVLIYLVYMLAISPLLSDAVGLNWKKSLNLLIRSILLIALVFGAFMFSRVYYKSQLTELEKLMEEEQNQDGNNGPAGYDEKHGLLERGKKPKKGDGHDGGNKGEKGDEGDDGESGYKLKDTMSMSDRMSQGDYIMFCAKINNFFPDGTPKPLYFVYHYLTKYDPARESFIRDTAMPYFDELNVDPSALPMYRSRLDSSVIKNSLATKERKVVEAEVYVSSNTWKHALLGPAGTYSCQTIPVDSSFGKMFRSAYKLKAYASELNNAYFVYNTSANPFLADFQEERYATLRTVPDYAAADTSLMNYYTQMPKGALYDSIKALAENITRNAKTPIDKVIAVRDYFLQTDAEGNRIYRYTLTPGAPSDPNIPNASMLGNFLFRTHAGYCTYYAGASLFLLRSVGVPTRFTTGFATIDRADKNKGWYWFYASQAHAWTQVYFPEYGWLDFDMTIGNDDQKESPQPDGTPPLPPPEPWLVIEGKAETAAGVNKRLDVSFKKIIFFNEDYRLGTKTTRVIDASVCRVLYGKKDTTLSAIQPGDSIFVVSYDDAAKQIPAPRSGVGIDQQVADFPSPIIADEIHIKPKEDKTAQEEKEKKKKEKPEKELTWKEILIRLGISAAGLAILLFLIPTIFLIWLVLRMVLASDPKKKADRAYRLALYHFHMAGVERGHETPLKYAELKADPVYRAGFGDFMRRYLRIKYTDGQLQPDDPGAILLFASGIRKAARNAKGYFNVLGSYFNLARANRYFRRPVEKDEDPDAKKDFFKNSDKT